MMRYLTPASFKHCNMSLKSGFIHAVLPLEVVFHQFPRSFHTRACAQRLPKGDIELAIHVLQVAPYTSHAQRLARRLVRKLDVPLGLIFRHAHFLSAAMPSRISRIASS